MLNKEDILCKDKALICFFQDGCSMCLEVEQLTELEKDEALNRIGLSVLDLDVP